jgi:predicted nucleic acid-binding protein
VTAPPKAAVIDACAVVALLTDTGHVGDWVATNVAGTILFAPHLMPYEASNILRRSKLAQIIDDTTATLAHADLMALPIVLDPYLPIADRIWELRHNVTAYDAAYVAIAEHRDIPLITVDKRLAGASGTRCRFLTPDSTPATRSAGP